MIHIGHGGKEIIKNHMILRADGTHMEIEDQTNLSGVFWRDTQELALAGMTIPFRNLLAILKLRIQDIMGLPQT